jgi:hypothetical protein
LLTGGSGNAVFTDSTGRAGDIIKAHEPTYGAPPEIYPDSDGGGIPDRHDPIE